MPEPKHLIFVNYRGTDEMWATEFVYARMTEAFGPETVFKAGNGLQPGDVYSPILLEKAAFCPVMLVCMGQAWLTTPGPDGSRRLDSPDDWVRKEIALSLRIGNHVIPLLFGNFGTTSLPKADDLPEELRSLIERQAVRLVPGGGLDLVVPRLVDRLAELVPELGRRRAARSVAAGESGSGDRLPSGQDAAPRDTYSTVIHSQQVHGDNIVGGKTVNNWHGTAHP
jgi:hypothetical protein